MKIADTIGVLLGCKPNANILSITPEQSVYEALEMLAKYNVGVLLVCSTVVSSASSRSETTHEKASSSASFRRKPRSRSL